MRRLERRRERVAAMGSSINAEDDQDSKNDGPPEPLVPDVLQHSVSNSGQERPIDRRLARETCQRQDVAGVPIPELTHVGRDLRTKLAEYRAAAAAAADAADRRAGE